MASRGASEGLVAFTCAGVSLPEWPGFHVESVQMQSLLLLPATRDSSCGSAHHGTLYLSLFVSSCHVSRPNVMYNMLSLGFRMQFGYMNHKPLVRNNSWPRPGWDKPAVRHLIHPYVVFESAGSMWQHANFSRSKTSLP